MLRSGSLRRALAVSASVGMAGVLAWLPAGSADAVPLPPAQLQAIADSNADSACAVTAGTLPATPPPIPFTHGRASDSSVIDVTWTNGSNSADVTHVTGHYTEKGRMTTAHGSLKTLNLSGQGNITVTKALGASSTCDVEGFVGGMVQAPMEVATSGWVYLTRTQPKGTISETAIESADGTPFVEIFAGPKNTSSTRVFLPAGQYLLLSVFEFSNGQLFLKAAPSVSLSATFRPAGSAVGAAKGAAGAYVTFPGSVSCAHHSATLTWKGKAGQVGQGTFLVNGQK